MTSTAQTEAAHGRLENYLAGDHNGDLSAIFWRCLEDPLKPRNEDGGFRTNPLLLLLIVLAMLGMITFLCFSLVP